MGGGGYIVAGCITKITYLLDIIIDEAVIPWRTYMLTFAPSCSVPLATRNYAELCTTRLFGKATVKGKGG